MRDGGWMVKFTDGSTQEGASLLVVPSGFLLVQAGKDARILRWSIAADPQDRLRHKHGMSMVSDSFPEVRSDNCLHKAYLDFLNQ